MGLLDKLLGWSKKKDGTRPTTQALPPQLAEDDDDEQTFFVSLKLSPRAQASVKRLRELEHLGRSRYRWVASGEVCKACADHVSGGPFSIAAGLTKAAPVPGRETSCDCQIELTGEA